MAFLPVPLTYVTIVLAGRRAILIVNDLPEYQQVLREIKARAVNCASFDAL